VQFNIRDHPHVDYGYAVTSHSSQGATADRVLVRVDTEHTLDELGNSRLAYVSVSRGRYDAQIYTNDMGKPGEELSVTFRSSQHWKPSMKRRARSKATLLKMASTNQ